ncbi:hypothetical protein ACHAQH_008162, partial [Verticillium albo-atrum]
MFWWLWLTLTFLGILPSVSAERILKSSSLDSCQKYSSFSASLFDVVFTPNNNSVVVKSAVLSTVQDYVIVDIILNVYGYEAMRQTVDPCELNQPTLCPLNPGKIPPRFKVEIDRSISQKIPDIAYSFPDLDAGVRVFINSTRTGESIACVEARFSNTKTVDLIGIKWATAAVTLIGLLTSAIMSGIGHTNTAAHLAASTLALFGYFQAQAMIGLSSVRLPPAAYAWTQNFAWTLGLVRIEWMQNVLTWYQRATGGKPTTLFDTMGRASVQVMKRSLDSGLSTIGDGTSALQERANVQLDTGAYVVFGIQRVGFHARIESTNIFMTSIVFCCALAAFGAIIVWVFSAALSLCVKRGWAAEERFLELQKGGWRLVLKGIQLRSTLLMFPPISVFCFWEFTQNDSSAITVIAA